MVSSMKSILLAAILALCGCATMQRTQGCPASCYDYQKTSKGEVCDSACYAYSGQVSKSECEAQCASYGYPLIRVVGEGCECDTSRCQRKGACEQLPVTPNSNPLNQL